MEIRIGQSEDGRPTFHYATHDERPPKAHGHRHANANRRHPAGFRPVHNLKFWTFHFLTPFLD